MEKIKFINFTFLGSIARSRKCVGLIIALANHVFVVKFCCCPVFLTCVNEMTWVLGKRLGRVNI